jgi:hypothetical protein
MAKTTIDPETVKRELERVLGMRSDRFLHQYDVMRDQFRYRFDAKDKSVTFSAYPEDLNLSLNDFSSLIIEPAAAELRGIHG